MHAVLVLLALAAQSHSSDSRQIRAAISSVDAAYAHHDAAAAIAYLAHDYQNIGTRGQMSNRAACIAVIKSFFRETPHLSARSYISSISVRRSHATVDLYVTISGRTYGRRASHTIRTEINETQTWARRHGQWQVTYVVVHRETEYRDGRLVSGR